MNDFEQPKTDIFVDLFRDKDDHDRFHLAIDGIEVFVGTKNEVFGILLDEEKFQKIIKECKK